MNINLVHNTVFPFYHLIEDDVPIHVRHLYPVRKIQTFKKDLEYLLRHYEPMDLSDLLQYLNHGKQRQKPGFFLSFDDGLREIYDIVAPMLTSYGIPAAFFINPSFVENADLFFRFKASILIENLNRLSTNQSNRLTTLLQSQQHQNALESIRYAERHLLDEVAKVMEISFKEYLLRVQPYMSLSQIQKLHNDGFYIGAHSMDHPRYNDISFEAQLSQTQQSLEYIKANVQKDALLFAFPFTDYGVKASFFKSIFADVIFGTAGMKNDPEPNIIHRIPMEVGNSSAAAIIAKQSAYYMIKYLFHKNTIARE
ncbi:MAG: polysaccharide deacetylase family protein [Chitinophagales bacterium]|nr:polysaccharide deacetylase family protein [Chitinophagales bacterium]